MKRDRATVEAELRALCAADFEEGDPAATGMERLYRLCDELSAVCTTKEAAPVLFALAERLEEAYLGSPGPVVHALEQMSGYEPYLRESLLRKPTSVTVGMANRLANARRWDRESWVQIMETVAASPRARPEVRESASQFARRQRAA